MDHNKATEQEPKIISIKEITAETIRPTATKEGDHREEKFCCNKCQDCKKKDIAVKNSPNV